MIINARADLQEHLTNIDDKLSKAPENRPEPENLGSETEMRAERECTLRCLEVCTQVAGFIEQRQRSLASHQPGIEENVSPDKMRGSSQRDTGQTMRTCNLQIEAQRTKLLSRLQYLDTRLRSSSEEAHGSADQVQMIEEADTIRQCLDICERSAKEAEDARVNVIEDVNGGEDSNHVIVSTIGDLIAAHRVTSGARSNMTIGQMSDETVQHLSTIHASRMADLSRPHADARAGADSGRSLGRVLGSSNVKTI